MRLTREDFQHAISEARKNDDDYASIPFRFGIPNAKEALIAGRSHAPQSGMAC